VWVRQRGATMTMGTGRNASTVRTAASPLALCRVPTVAFLGPSCTRAHASQVEVEALSRRAPRQVERYTKENVRPGLARVGRSYGSDAWPCHAMNPATRSAGCTDPAC
jgi:hypothetical protein